MQVISTNGWWVCVLYSLYFFCSLSGNLSGNFSALDGIQDEKYKSESEKETRC